MKSNYSNKELDMLSERSFFSREQLELINQATDKKWIEIKIDEFGRKYKSVKSSYAKRFVTLVTGGRHNFEIKSKEFIASTHEITVEARLTITNEKGETQYREQGGSFKLRTIKSDKGYNSRAVNIADGYKSAMSDAFKKCASEFQFFWDIYNQKLEPITLPQKELSYQEKKIIERLRVFFEKCRTIEEIDKVYFDNPESIRKMEAAKDLKKEYEEKLMSEMRPISINKTSKII